MTDDAPRIASSLERSKLFMAACLMFFEAPLMFGRSDPFAVVMFLGGLYMSLDVVRVLSTRVSSAGISQITSRGRIHMPWDEVTAVTRRKRSIVLTSDQGRVDVPTESFYDTRAAVDYLESHLPSRLRRQ